MAMAMWILQLSTCSGITWSIMHTLKCICTVGTVRSIFFRILLVLECCVIKWERIWEKGPIGNFFTNSIPEKLPF